MLKDFCESSGHKISATKTRIVFSHNMTASKVTNIGNEFGFQASNNLGLYSRVPLLHSRVTMAAYRYILDKVRRKLSRWKTNLLSMVGYMNLAKSVLMAIFAYAMLTTHSPIPCVTKLMILCGDSLGVL